MSDADYQRWTDGMAAAMFKSRPPAPKYTGTTVAAPSCRDVAEWPDWMLFEKLDGDVAAYIVELRGKFNLEKSERKELDEWRKLLDGDMTDICDVEQALNEVEGLEEEIADLKNNAIADDGLVIELRTVLEECQHWIGPDTEMRAKITAALQKVALATDDDEAEEPSPHPSESNAQDRLRDNETVAG